MRKNEAQWYWSIIIITLASTILILAVPENSYPLVYSRYLIGAIIALCLPGYTFTRILYPANLLGTQSEEPSFVERAALSLGVGIALFAVLGVLLNYSPWGIRTIPLVMSLMVLTLSFATIAMVNEYRTKTEVSVA